MNFIHKASFFCSVKFKSDVNKYYFKIKVKGQISEKCLVWTRNELHLIKIGYKSDFMMRHTFSVNSIKAHFIFSISKIISKVNESIQISRSTVRMQENVLHVPDTICI